MKKLFTLSGLIILIAFGNLFAQQEAAYQFLNIDMSARAGALAGSFVSNNDDADVIFYNPAGVGTLEGTPVSFSFVKHLLDINLASLSYSTNLENIGRIGAAVKYINYGTFVGADDAGNKTGNYGAGEVAFIAGYSNILDKNLFYGANLKFIFSKLADVSSSAVAMDLGLHYSMPENLLDFGFSILNAGTQLSSYYSTREDLPLDIVIGASKKMEHMPVKVSLDFHNLNDTQYQFASRFQFFTFGAEFYLSKAFRLRFGYDNQKRQELKIGNFSGLAGFNVGLGLTVSNYNFDYGFSSLGLVGAMHRVTISTHL